MAFERKLANMAMDAHIDKQHVPSSPVPADESNFLAGAVHLHGLSVPSDVDGAEEEGTPMVPPGGMQRYSFVPRPAGTRWYHSHMHAGRDLKKATYTGQFGFLYIEPKDDPGRYDAEIFLALHGWDPHLDSLGDEGNLEVTYSTYSVNSHALGSGDPVRVKEGQKVLFHILNASATDQHRIALSAHKFKIVGLDGNAVPVPCEVDVIEMGPAERVDALVTMNNPGVWISATQTIKYGMPEWVWSWNMPIAAAHRSGPSRRMQHGTIRSLGAKSRQPNPQAVSYHSSSARNLQEIAGWITGQSTANPFPRAIPFGYTRILAIAYTSTTKVMSRTQFTYTGTRLN